jgi:hypothetical protein
MAVMKTWREGIRETEGKEKWEKDVKKWQLTSAWRIDDTKQIYSQSYTYNPRARSVGNPKAKTSEQ